MSRNTNTNTKITSNLTTIPLELRHAVYDVIANTEYDINHDPSVSRCNYDSITPLNVAQLSSAFRAEFLEHLCTTITFNVRLNFWPSPMPQPPFPYFYNYDPSNDNSEIIASRHWLEQLGSEAPLKKIRLILKNGIANNNTSHDWEAYVHVHIKAGECFALPSFCSSSARLPFADSIVAPVQMASV